MDANVINVILYLFGIVVLLDIIFLHNFIMKIKIIK